MKIGIDISQLAHRNTGVGNYLFNLVDHLLKLDSGNEYVLFYSSLRRRIQSSKFKVQNDNSRPKDDQPLVEKLKIRRFFLPPTLLDLLWNKLHVLPIEWLIGDVDVFISSDWTQPPSKAKKATILYDLIVYKYPQETDRKIIETQKRKLKWVKKECDLIFCISEATKKDAMEILGIPESKLRVIYPGI
ncbi:MAG: glycosyltransferase [Candidatus Levybacteria bacterium]|nr:glycosyltransferase [Candidatus Levybacteria bacterium]